MRVYFLICEKKSVFTWSISVRVILFIQLLISVHNGYRYRHLHFLLIFALMKAFSFFFIPFALANKHEEEQPLKMVFITIEFHRGFYMKTYSDKWKAKEKNKFNSQKKKMNDYYWTIFRIWRRKKLDTHILWAKSIQVNAEKHQKNLFFLFE